MLHRQNVKGLSVTVPGRQMQTLFCTYKVYSLQSQTKIYLNNLANTNKIAIVKNAMRAIMKDVL